MGATHPRTEDKTRSESYGHGATSDGLDPRRGARVYLRGDARRVRRGPSGGCPAVLGAGDQATRHPLAP